MQKFITFMKKNSSLRHERVVVNIAQMCWFENYSYCVLRFYMSGGASSYCYIECNYHHYIESIDNYNEIHKLVDKNVSQEILNFLKSKESILDLDLILTKIVSRACTKPKKKQVRHRGERGNASN